MRGDDVSGAAYKCANLVQTRLEATIALGAMDESDNAGDEER